MVLTIKVRFDKQCSVGTDKVEIDSSNKIIITNIKFEIKGVSKTSADNAVIYTRISENSFGKRN